MIKLSAAAAAAGSTRNTSDSQINISLAASRAARGKRQCELHYRLENNPNLNE
jgi:hypothetical protein